MAEAVANISECERGALHVDEDFAAVEFIPNPGGPGYKIIGANFTNSATPLQYVDYLERTSRGKLRFVISEIPQSQIGKTL